MLRPLIINAINIIWQKIFSFSAFLLAWKERLRWWEEYNDLRQKFGVKSAPSDRYERRNLENRLIKTPILLISSHGSFYKRGFLWWCYETMTQRTWNVERNDFWWTSSDSGMCGNDGAPEAASRVNLLGDWVPPEPRTRSKYACLSRPTEYKGWISLSPLSLIKTMIRKPDDHRKSWKQKKERLAVN